MSVTAEGLWTWTLGYFVTCPNLKKAIFEDAFLIRAHLEKANLEGANFEGACLIEAHLNGAELRGVNLQAANLGGANLEDADLQEANLKGASFKEANPTRTDLTKAEHLTLNQLSKAKTLYETKLDEKLLIPLKRKYPALFEKSYSNYWKKQHFIQIVNFFRDSQMKI